MSLRALPAKRRGVAWQSILLFLLVVSPLAADSLKDENFRLRQEIAMEEEASRLLGQKVLKAYEEKVILENKFKDKEEKIKGLEKELAAVRKLMEKEVASYQRKLQILYKKSGFKAYIETLEEEKRALEEKLAHAAKQPLPTGKVLTGGAVSKGKVLTGGAVSKGKVVSVSKKFKFIIIEFEDTAAIDIGRIFLVFRGEKKISEVKVIKIKKRYVFSDIVNTITDEEIKVGDVIR